MRIAFFGLLLANLVLFAWSQWLSPSTQPAANAPVSAATAATARIMLASERPADAAATTIAPVPSAGPSGDAGAGSAEASTDGQAPEGGVVDPSMASVVPVNAATPAAGLPAPSAGAAGAAIPPAAALAVPARRCASMGPFTDLDLTAQATAMLKQDGYEPRQRPASGAVPDGYMVVIRRLKNEADQARVVGRLNRGGLDDAFAIPRLEDGYAVSVGLFTQLRRAERRGQVVDNMGFKSEIVERTRPGTVYWLDFDLKTPAAGAADPFTKTADPSQKVQVVPCPGSAAVG